MGRRISRTLVAALGMIGFATVVFVQAVPAQEQERADEAQEPQESEDDLRLEPPHRRAPHSRVLSFSTDDTGAYLGVYIREVTDEDVDRLDLPEERGAFVAEVPDDGPAAEAGLEADDVIVSWDGRPIVSAAQLRRVVGETPAGRTVAVGYIRDGDERTVSVEVAERGSGAFARRFGELPESLRDGDAWRERFEALELDGLDELHELNDGLASVRVIRSGGRLGARIQNMSDQLAEYFGASDGGVLVTSVREDSPASDAGLRAGDVIVAIDGEEVDDPGDVSEEISEADDGDGVEIRVLRDHSERTLQVTLPEESENLGAGGAYFFQPEEGSFEFFGPELGASLTIDRMAPMVEHMMPMLPELDFDFEVIPEFEVREIDPPTGHVPPAGAGVVRT